MKKGSEASHLGKNLDSKSGKRLRHDHAKFEYELLEPRQLMAGDLASPDGQWLAVDHSVLQARTGEPLIRLSNHGLFDLNESNMQRALSAAPLEFTQKYQENAVTISIPRPDSTFATFKVVESPIMEPALAAKFPDFKTYRGWGMDRPEETVRFDVTSLGFRAQIMSPDGYYYIDPFFKGETELYSSYFKGDVVRGEQDTFTCGCGGCGCGGCTTEELTEKFLEEPESSPYVRNFGTQLRTFRLAVAATGEYTSFWGGTVTNGQAAIVTAVNRVTGVYERDLAIRMVLVGNNSSLVYTNPGTDPYSNGNGSAMLSQNQSTIDSVIGNANYDIGHVFSTGGGGIAGLGVVGVTGSKARGVTGQPSPTGDPFYIDYVAHEMGHQFGANHTFNGTGGSCSGNRSSGSAYEPGSGVTIMAYAGICGADNLATFSDAMFHAKSIEAIRTFITSGAASGTGTNTNTGNSVPNVSTSSGFVIPANTPFELTATGSDANASQVLTYSWEQYNLGTAAALSAADNGSRPLFRTWNPTTSSTRVFPRLQNLVNNTLPIGEKLPTANWTAASPMRFRVVARDNASGGGGVRWAEMTMQVVNTGTAFAVTSHNSATSWAGGSTQTLTWNVAGTTGSGINTSAVDIWLSTDGGFTYTTQLAAGVPNDGSQPITVPNIQTTQARFKIKASNSVYFDINNANISITPVNILANVSGPATIIEGDTGTSIANFPITLSAAPTATVTVNYATNNTGFANPASPGSDYGSVSGTATFLAGQTTVNVPVTIIGDRFTEGVEQFRMTLSNPVGVQLGTSTFVASILDDDAFELGKIIDFGSLESRVEPGTTGFSLGSHNSFTGIGWTSATQLTPFVLKQTMNAVRYDGIFGQSGNFRIDVPNGNYDVELIFGWMIYGVTRALAPASYSQFNVIVQGTNYNLALEEGDYVTRNYSATVTNGQLNIGLQQGIGPAKIAGILVTQAGQRSSAASFDNSKLVGLETRQDSRLSANPLGSKSVSMLDTRIPTSPKVESKIFPRLQIAAESRPSKAALGKLDSAGIEIAGIEIAGIAAVDRLVGSNDELASRGLVVPAQLPRLLDQWFESNDIDALTLV